jgi:hypothetical protein
MIRLRLRLRQDEFDDFRFLIWGRGGQVRKSGMKDEFRFDQANHLSEGLPQDGVVVSHFGEISARVMLRPKLVGQTIREVFKRREPWVQDHRFGHESAQVVNLSKFPTAANKICLEKPLGSLLHQLDHGLGGTLNEMEQVGGVQAATGGSQPICGVVFVGFQTSLSPL